MRLWAAAANGQRSQSPPFLPDRLAARLVRKDSLALKLSQRPDRFELVERNILQSVTDDDRRLDRTVIGTRLSRRLSLPAHDRGLGGQEHHQECVARYLL